MRTWIGLAAATVVAMAIITALTGPGSAVPVENGRIPHSLQSLLENPVIQVKKHCKMGKCLECKKYCEDWKHSDYCKHNHDDPSCCKDWEKKCYCAPCLDHVE